MVVWDIASGTPVISLEDPVQAASGSRSGPGKGGAVKGLAWVMANPARLAIVLAGGMVLVWDVQGASQPIMLGRCILHETQAGQSSCWFGSWQNFARLAFDMGRGMVLVWDVQGMTWACRVAR